MSTCMYMICIRIYTWAQRLQGCCCSRQTATTPYLASLGIDPGRCHDQSAACMRVCVCAGMIAPSEDSAWAEEGLQQGPGHDRNQPQQPERQRATDDTDR